MSRYIDAEQIEFVTGGLDESSELDYVRRYNIDRIPTADVVEVRHGRWDGDSCSVCWFSWCDVTYDVPQMQMPYCPSCGARMDKECEDESR